MMATMKRDNSVASRSHIVPETQSTTTDATRTSGSLPGGVIDRRTPALNSGTIHRYAAAGANHSDIAARAIHIGSATLHVNAGCLAGWLRAGSQRPSRAIPHATATPVTNSRS